MAKALLDYIKLVDEHTERNNIFLQAENKKKTLDSQKQKIV